MYTQNNIKSSQYAKAKVYAVWKCFYNSSEILRGYVPNDTHTHTHRIKCTGKTEKRREIGCFAACLQIN